MVDSRAKAGKEQDVEPGTSIMSKIKEGLKLDGGMSRDMGANLMVLSVAKSRII